MNNSLVRITLRGFKTIRELNDFEPGRLTVLIGPNGAGKSNFISFFRMLSRAWTPPGELQTYIAEQGGASALLHDGSTRTREIAAVLRIQAGSATLEYRFHLAHAAGDTLIIADEHWEFGEIRRECWFQARPGSARVCRYFASRARRARSAIHLGYI